MGSALQRTTRETVEGGVGPVAGREPHGCGDRAYMDVLAASPKPDPPRHPTECTLLLLRLMLPASGRHYRGAGRSPADAYRTGTSYAVPESGSGCRV